ncbi:hypothetical protein JHK82_036333 [Glycine max]|nr:hypothetical protein JHK86_036518 [Glycine max]KAG5113064.1 hypothetical protein JHK82_036333 [Glycine max]KAH1101627.1 hypothetical protein GYH30_036272 [Glycine max]
MHDERLQPHAQSYEFTPQPHHHQEDYGYNPQFVSVRIMFECSSDPKVITTSEDMSLAALRKTIFYGNRGCRILINVFYRQPIYVGDNCLEYNCMKLKCNNDVGKMFLICSEFSTKGPIKFNAIFGCSLDEILALLHKPRKSRTTDEIIALMHDEYM